MGQTPARLLVAEDDRAVRDALVRALELEGYEVAAAVDGAGALTYGQDHNVDLYLLDIGMPNVDGLTVCRTLRSRRDDTPILVLTARHEIADRVVGLDAGADDYLVKPFALAELLARVRALLRRESQAGDDMTLMVGHVSLHRPSRSVEVAGEGVKLTKLEFDLLELLMLNKGIVLHRDTIYEQIWGYDFETQSKSLDVYIGYLRRKTKVSGQRQLIETVRGVGYVIKRPDGLR